MILKNSRDTSTRAVTVRVAARHRHREPSRPQPAAVHSPALYLVTSAFSFGTDRSRQSPSWQVLPSHCCPTHEARGPRRGLDMPTQQEDATSEAATFRMRAEPSQQVVEPHPCTSCRGLPPLYACEHGNDMQNHFAAVQLERGDSSSSRTEAYLNLSVRVQIESLPA